MSHVILSAEFFDGPCVDVSQALVGKLLCRRLSDGTVKKMRILETEAYCGPEDTACHVHRGRTARTEIFYSPAGTLYVYLCYGIHWMLNIVTGQADDPQAVLIRSCKGAEGPGRLTKALEINKTFHGRNLDQCADVLWIEDDGQPCQVKTAPRVGIGYASPEDQAKPWRFILI